MAPPPCARPAPLPLPRPTRSPPPRPQGCSAVLSALAPSCFSSISLTAEQPFLPCCCPGLVSQQSLNNSNASRAAQPGRRGGSPCPTTLTAFPAPCDSKTALGGFCDGANPCPSKGSGHKSTTPLKSTTASRLRARDCKHLHIQLPCHPDNRLCHQKDTSAQIGFRP